MESPGEKYRKNKITGLLTAKSDEEKIRKLEEWLTILNNAKPPSSISYSILRDFDLYHALFGYPPGNKQWNNDKNIKKWHEKKEKYIDSIKDYKKSLEEKNHSKKHKIQVKKEKENEKQLNKSKDYDLRLGNISESLNNALRNDPNNEELKKLQENINTAKDVRNIDKKFYKNLVDAIQNQVIQTNTQNNNKRIGKHIIINNNNLNYDYNVVADAYERLAELHANYSAFLTSKLDDKNINKDDVRKYYNHIKALNKKIADWANAIYENGVAYNENTDEIAVNISPAKFLYILNEINKETNDSLIELKTKDTSKEPWKTALSSSMAEFKEDVKNQLQNQKNETNNIIDIAIESSEQSINNAQFNDKKALEDELKKTKEEKEKLKPEVSLNDLNKISAKLTILHNKIYFANQEFENKRIAAEAILKSFPQETKFKIGTSEHTKNELMQLVNENKVPETSLDEIINHENEIKAVDDNPDLKGFTEIEIATAKRILDNSSLFSQEIIEQAKKVLQVGEKTLAELNSLPKASDETNSSSKVSKDYFENWKNTPALSDEQGFRKIDANTQNFTKDLAEQKAKNLETLTDSINFIRNFSSKDDAEKIKAVSSGFVKNVDKFTTNDFLNRQISITNAENNQTEKTVLEIFKEDLKTKLENCKQILDLFHVDTSNSPKKFQNKIDSINEIINLIDNDQNNVENFLQIKEKVEKLPTELQNPIKNPLDHNNISIVFDMLNAIQTIDPSITGKVGLPESIADIDRWAQKSKKILTAELKKLVYLVRKNNPSQTGQSSAEITDDASVENISGAGQEPTQANNEANNEIDEIKAILRNPNPNEAEINSLITYLQNNNNNPPDLSDPNTEVSQKDKKEIIKKIDKKINGLKALLKIETTEYEKSSKREDENGLKDKEKHFNNIKTILDTIKKLENMSSRIKTSDTYTKKIYLEDKIRRQEFQNSFIKTKEEGRFISKTIYNFPNEQEH